MSNLALGNERVRTNMSSRVEILEVLSVSLVSSGPAGCNEVAHVDGRMRNLTKSRSLLFGRSDTW